MILSREYFVYLLIIATGFIIGLFKYNNNPKLKPVVTLLGVTLISEIISRILAHKIKNSSPGYHFFTPVQIILWAWFFLLTIKSNLRRQSVLLLTGSLVLFSIANTIFLQGLKVFPDNVLKLESVFLIAFAILLFIQLLDAPSGHNLFKDPIFYIAVAVLWFNLISFIFFQFHAYLIKNIVPSQTLRTIHLISNYVYYSLVLFAIILSKRTNSIERKFE